MLPTLSGFGFVAQVVRGSISGNLWAVQLGGDPEISKHRREAEAETGFTKRTIISIFRKNDHRLYRSQLKTINLFQSIAYE